jgi:hypothetical protein
VSFPDIDQTSVFVTRTVRKAVLGMMAMRRMSTMPMKTSQLALDVEQYRKDAEEVRTHDCLVEQSN